MAFEVPSNLILSRTKPSIFLPAIMIIWGICTCCMARVQTYGQLVALRVIVGIFEAGFAPGIILILSSWYKKNEQSKRFAAFISAAVLSGAFGGILAGAIIESMDGRYADGDSRMFAAKVLMENGRYGIQGWRWLFVRHALPTDAAAVH